MAGLRPRWNELKGQLDRNLAPYMGRGWTSQFDRGLGSKLDELDREYTAMMRANKQASLAMDQASRGNSLAWHEVYRKYQSSGRHAQAVERVSLKCDKRLEEYKDLVMRGVRTDTNPVARTALAKALEVFVVMQEAVKHYRNEADRYGGLNVLRRLEEARKAIDPRFVTSTDQMHDYWRQVRAE